MGTHFSLIKHTGRDIHTIGDELTEDDVVKLLLSSADESLFLVTEWDSNYIEEDGTPLLVEQLNGEEWLADHL